MIWMILVPIVIAVIYLVIGFFICKNFIKNEHIHTAGDFWFYFLLWLPAFTIGGIWSLFSWLGRFPKRFAENQINKQ